MNKAFITAILSICIAQLLKVPLNRKENNKGIKDAAKLIYGSGGMPSSHAAGVTSLATYIALQKGWRSVDFALASVFGIIVMYDAMGVRYHAGEIARDVNHIEEEVERLAEEHAPGRYHRQREEDLKEMLGHIPAEVAAGALLGTGLGAAGYWLLDK